MKGIKLCDIGANLCDGRYRGIYFQKKKHNEDFAQLFRRCVQKEYVVDKIVLTSTTYKDFHRNIDLIEKAHSNKWLKVDDVNIDLVTTIGIHPTRCNEFKKDKQLMKKLKEMAIKYSDQIVAIGEMGLDYDRLKFCDKETQLEYFELQLKELVPTVKKPLFLHNRNSFDDFYAILSRYCKNFSYAVVHSFDGTLEEATKLLDLHPGLHIGINGCSLRSKQSLEVVAKLPLDRLHIETDCPYCEVKKSHPSYELVKTHFTEVKMDRYTLSEETLVKSRNEPVKTIQVAEVIASLHKKSIEEVCTQFYQNSQKVFFPGKKRGGETFFFSGHEQDV